MSIEKLDKFTIRDGNDCWVWTKSTNSSGYGQITINKKYWTTHRLSYTLHCGEIPKGVLVRHTCHNRRCWNPHHLELGSDKDNWYDSKDTHLESSKRSRKTWNINGVSYSTCREAVDKTGISMGSIMKYTKNGIFDIDQYRAGCKIAQRTPKI